MSVKTAETAALELMDRVMDARGALPAEYPLVFRPDFDGRVLCVEEAGRPVSACAVLERELLFDGGPLKVGLIGTVVTDPEARGRGLATELLGRAADELRKSGAALSFLWADDPEYYRKRGYATVGHEVVYAVEAGHFAARELPADMRTATEHDAESIHRLYTRHATRVARGEQETRALLETPGMSTLVRELGGEVSAYACMGRGRDLEGMVHEWGGLPEEVLGLVHAFTAARLAHDETRPLHVMTPPDARGLHAALDRLGAPCFHGVLGMARLLDPEAAAGLLRSRVEDVPLGSFTVKPGEQGDVQLRARGGHASLAPQELLELLFPPHGDRGAHEELSRRLGVDLSRAAFEPYVWGLDSI